VALNRKYCGMPCSGTLNVGLREISGMPYYEMLDLCPINKGSFIVRN